MTGPGRENDPLDSGVCSLQNSVRLCTVTSSESLSSDRFAATSGRSQIPCFFPVPVSREFGCRAALICLNREACGSTPAVLIPLIPCKFPKSGYALSSSRPLSLYCDCNGDGDTSGLTDAIFVLGRNFLGGSPPPCRAACDVNGDGDTGSVTDAIYLLTHNFLGGPAPVEPYPSCGPRQSDSDWALGCQTPPVACQ